LINVFLAGIAHAGCIGARTGTDAIGAGDLARAARRRTTDRGVGLGLVGNGVDIRDVVLVRYRGGRPRLRIDNVAVFLTTDSGIDRAVPGSAVHARLGGRAFGTAVAVQAIAVVGA